MEKRTLEQLDAALDAIREDLASRVEELAEKSTAGVLTPEEHKEYTDVVRLNDTLSLLRLQAERSGPCARPREAFERYPTACPAPSAECV